ncbi:MAG: alpha/beta fold hydrolase [Caulobacter sp.]|nr:alpha/beta fold hydrolase [Caulobacter sp.]
MRLILGAALAAGAVTLAGGAHAAAPKFTPGACAGDYTGVPNKIECGTLTVDETRGGPGARRVSIPVTIVKAISPKAGLPPVVYLHGGPGGGTVEAVGRVMRSPAGKELVGVDQDWIYFDQRGGGLAQPMLDCGQVAMSDAGPLSDAAAHQLIACGQRLKESGVDLTRYNAEEVVKDVQDLRKTLGLKQIDLAGVSYGTRIALAVVKHDPSGVRAVVLDSPWTPEAKWAEGGPEMVSDAVKEIFKRCAADTDCNAKFPHPGADLDAVANKLLAGPVTANGRTYTPDLLGGFLMDAAYSGPDARALPATVAKFAAGDFSALDDTRAGAGYAEAQHLTHLCKEEFPFESEAAMRRGAQRDPVTRLMANSFGRYFQVCKTYAVGAPDPVEAQPVSSPIPTFFLAAEIDPGCPPAVAKAAVGRFSKGQLTIVPNTTHGVFRGSACARKMIRSFLADPTAPVDQSCLHPEHDKFVFDLG